MTNGHGFIISFLLSRNLLLIFAIEFEFEVEILESLWMPMDSGYVPKKEPTLPDDFETRNALCVEAKNYISFVFVNPQESPGNMFSSWGHPSYVDKINEDERYFNFMNCNETMPRMIRIRAAEPSGKFIIMIDGIRERGDGSYYGLSGPEYNFKVKFVEGDPSRSTNDELEGNILSTIKDGDLHELHKKMAFMNWIYVCFKARDSILNYAAFKNTPVTQPSPVGCRYLRLYNYHSGRLEEHVGYRCPILPALYTCTL